MEYLESKQGEGWVNFLKNIEKLWFWYWNFLKGSNIDAFFRPSTLKTEHWDIVWYPFRYGSVKSPMHNRVKSCRSIKFILALEKNVITRNSNKRIIITFQKNRLINLTIIQFCNFVKHHSQVIDSKRTTIRTDLKRL